MYYFSVLIFFLSTKNCVHRHMVFIIVTQHILSIFITANFTLQTQHNALLCVRNSIHESWNTKKKFFLLRPGQSQFQCSPRNYDVARPFLHGFLVDYLIILCFILYFFFVFFESGPERNAVAELKWPWNSCLHIRTHIVHRIFCLFFFFLVFIRFQLWSYGRYLDHSPQAMNKIGMAIIIMRMSDAYENSYNYLQVNWFTYLLATIHT